MGELLPETAVRSLDEYRSRGGGDGLEQAAKIGPEETIGIIRASGLRGRGGAGFPTGIKWSGVAGAEGERFVVCNAAEGEPGTFKDRAILRRDPYQVLEGIAIAAMAVGADEAFVGIKARFETERERLAEAADEMAAAGMLDHVTIRLVPGPDDYLFGVESAMLEVIEGKDPLPRLYPPYVQGLFTDQAQPSKPTVVNNVETLANVPHILRLGVHWFRSRGTEASPGTMVFTVCGDVRRETVVELPLGTPLSLLMFGPGEGLEAGRRASLVVSGVSNAPLTPDLLDTQMSFEGMAAVRSGLGSGGFIVYDDTTCIAEVAAVLSSFLFLSSCGQCPPCKLGTGALFERFTRVMEGSAQSDDIEEIVAWVGMVTDANRCGLGAGQRALAGGIMDRFADDIVSCMQGGCAGHRGLSVPRITDWDEETGRFWYTEDPEA